jgi:hypothetical protein
MCAALAHMPLDAIDEGWLHIMESSPDYSKVQDFNDYFVEQWLENDVIQYIWNCNGERHRTTNALEEWHNRLNRAIGKYRVIHERGTSEFLFCHNQQYQWQ